MNEWPRWYHGMATRPPEADFRRQHNRPKADVAALSALAAYARPSIWKVGIDQVNPANEPRILHVRNLCPTQFALFYSCAIGFHGWPQNHQFALELHVANPVGSHAVVIGGGIEPCDQLVTVQTVAPRVQSVLALLTWRDLNTTAADD